MSAGGLALSLVLLTPQAPRPAEIDEAVRRAAEHLTALYADGVGRGLPSGEPELTLQDHPGLRALTLYALLHAGVEPDADVVHRLVSHLSFERFETTYDASCMLLALCELEAPWTAEWVDELATFLLAHRTEAGAWGYPDGEDLSNTQFAAMALHVAEREELRIPADVWRRLAERMLAYRHRDGGFVYRVGSREVTGSMTAAGTAVLAICREHLPAEAFGEELSRALAGGREWLGRNLAFDRNPRHSAWRHYFLYSLERAGSIAGIRELDGRDWHAEGARVLLEEQLVDGTWSGTFERVPTLFAVLFLKRASLPRAPRTPGPLEPVAQPVVERRTPRARDGLDLRGSVARLRASSTDAGKHAGRAVVPELAVDGNPRTPWVAAEDDRAPTLRIDLRRPVRAREWVLLPPRVCPPEDPGPRIPVRVELKTSGGTRVARADDAGVVRFELDPPERTRRIEIRVLESRGAGDAVGIGEVLYLAAD